MQYSASPFDQTSDRCASCAGRFGISRWRHHCRSCGKAFCTSCCFTGDSKLKFADGSFQTACRGCASALSCSSTPSSCIATPQPYVCQGIPVQCCVDTTTQKVVVSDSGTTADKMLTIQRKHEINAKYMPLLAQLEDYDVILVCDDSGSMSNTADLEVPNVTRWMELQQYAKIVLDISLVFERPISVYFINRGVYHNVSSVTQLESYFSDPPGGGTNLVATLANVFLDRQSSGNTRPAIVHVFTDGHPTNAGGVEDMAGFASFLSARPNIENNFVAILLCTDDEDVADAYRPLEDYYFANAKTLAMPRRRRISSYGSRSQGIRGVDVTEDFRGEKLAVQSIGSTSLRLFSQQRPFTFGDYIVKCLVGCINVEIHKIDLR